MMRCVGVLLSSICAKNSYMSRVLSIGVQVSIITFHTECMYIAPLHVFFLCDNIDIIIQSAYMHSAWLAVCLTVCVSVSILNSRCFHNRSGC